MSGWSELTACGIGTFMQVLAKGCPQLILSDLDQLEPEEELELYCRLNVQVGDSKTINGCGNNMRRRKTMAGQ